MYLSLPIPSTKSSKIDIHSCLEAFVKPEVMEKSDAWCVIFKITWRFVRAAASETSDPNQELPTMQNTA
jgi:hypothetical protein